MYMKSSKVLSGIKTITATDFLSLEPEKYTNYIHFVLDDTCADLLKDLADITVTKQKHGLVRTCIAVCLWVHSPKFELYLPDSQENQDMQLEAELERIEKPYIKVVMEVGGLPSERISVQEIYSSDATKYYLNPYSDIYSRNPF